MKHDSAWGERIVRHLSWPSAMLVAAMAFNTGANAQVVFTEDFTGGASTAGFTVDQVEGTCTWAYDNQGARDISGANFDADFAIFDSDFCGFDAGQATANLVSPAFDASAGNFLLTFDQSYRTYTTTTAAVEVWDGTQWNEVYSPVGASVGYPNPAVSMSINITAAAGGSNEAQVRFVYGGDYQYWWAVDNIAVEAVGCLYPSDLAVSNITTDGASFSWTDNGSTGYEWAVTDGSTPDGTNELASGDGSNMDATGLDSGTPYTVFVRADCSGTFSPWSGGVNFSTGITNDDCDGALTVPVNPNFECGQTVAGTVTGATGSGVTSTCVGTANDDVWFTFMATDTLHRFSLINQTGSTTDMVMMLWEGTCGSLVAVPNGCSDPQVMNVGGLTPGTTYYLQVYTYFSTPGATAAFDVCIGTLPSCQPPMDIALDSFTPPDASISWTDNGADSYDYEVRSSGDAGSGATGLEQSGNVAGSPLALTGLSDNIDYQVYVRSNCAGGDSSIWSAPVLLHYGYCISNFGNVDFEHITNVTFGDIDNSSAGDVGGPVDYTDQSTEVAPSGTYDISVSMETDANEYLYAFIDWNQNLLLDDAGEVYTLASSFGGGPLTVDTTIAVPADALAGATRMRIMLDYNHDIPNPCQDALYGEAEDYSVVVTGGTTPEYCDSLSYQFDVEPICNVTFAGIDNSSSAEVNGTPALEDFTATTPAMVTQGATYPISVTGNTAGAYVDSISVFFDWDQDGTFETVEELGGIDTDTCTMALIGSITVPLDAVLGNTRMRVVKNWNVSPIDPCGAYGYGQGEDYTVQVDLSIGIPEANATSLSLAPNPAHDRIALINLNGKATQAIVYDMVGNLVLRTASVDAINITSLTAGSYILVAQDAAGAKLAHLRFVKQ
ncbi:MAG: GEVED domain-containing protein [Flavobacteriales bacterium]